MEKLRFGEILNVNGSLRKIHILENTCPNIWCKSDNLNCIFNAERIFSFYDIPTDIGFFRECYKKSICKKQIFKYFQFETNQYTKMKNKSVKQEVNKYSTNTNDNEEYVPQQQKRRRRKYKKRPKKLALSPKGFIPLGPGILCHYCKKVIINYYEIYMGHVFHKEFSCREKYLEDSKDNEVESFDSSIYKYAESKDLTLLR